MLQLKHLPWLPLATVWIWFCILLRTNSHWVGTKICTCHPTRIQRYRDSQGLLTGLHPQCLGKAWHIVGAQLSNCQMGACAEFLAITQDILGRPFPPIHPCCSSRAILAFILGKVAEAKQEAFLPLSPFATLTARHHPEMEPSGVETAPVNIRP